MPDAPGPAERPVIRCEPLAPDETFADREAAGWRPSSGRTLRIALAMRGGVSLAVWIGGVAAELDVLRRIRLYDRDGATVALFPHPAGAAPSEAVRERVETYAALLDRARYDRVEIDLLAGASAGGLNAVVYAVAQRAGVTLDDLLGTWGRVGGFWGLLHGPRTWTPRALMRGEGYFRPRVRDALEAMYRSDAGHPDLVPTHVSVDLSTTIIDGGDQVEEDIVDGRGHFHFVGSDTHHLDNLVPRRGALDYPGKDRDDGVLLGQLALAARSTSSLAGGFEPAEIVSTEWPGPDDLADPRDPRRAAAGAGAGETTAPGPSLADRDDLRFAFAAHRAAPAEPFRVIDGAVFDNVPIDRALRAAKLRESRRRADRLLVFLDPEPDPAFSGVAPWDPDATRFFRAVGTMFSKSMRRESVAREASDLQRFNGERALEASRRVAGAGLLAHVGEDDEELAVRRTAYVGAMGAVVAEHLADVLGAPSLWQLQSATRRRRRYATIDRTALIGFGDLASERFAHLAANAPDTAVAGPLALADAASCLLAWVRDVESVPEVPGGRHLRELHAIRQPAYTALQDANGSIDAVTEHVLLEVLRTRGSGRAPTREEFDAWLTTWIARSDEVDASAHWRALDGCLAELVALTAGVEATIDDHDEPAAGAWRRSPWRAIGLAAPARAVDLAPIAYPVGIPAALSRVDYWAIGVDEEPASQGAYTELLRDRFLTRLQTALRTPRTGVDEAVATLAEPERIDRQTKLAGYGFGNFLGFLAKEWRVNDWWWGRLDGSAGVVRLLDSRAPGREPGALDADLERVQTAVLAESDEAAYRDAGLSLLSPPDEVPAADLRARVRSGTDILWNLGPGYRFALASRAIRLLDRAAAPANRFLVIGVQAVLALVRPALVGLPAVADPPRLALVAGLTAGTAWLLTWSTFAPTTGSIVTAAIAALALLALLASGIARSRARWHRVRRALAETGADRSSGETLDESARATAKYATVAVASLAPLVIALASANVTMAILCLGVSLAMTSVAVRAASGARPTTVPRRLLRTNLMVGTFVLLGGVLPIVQAIVSTRPDAPDWLHALVEPPLHRDLPVLAIGAALVTIALTLDWLPIHAPAARREPDDRRSFRWMSWLTVTVAAVAFGWLVARGVEALMLASGIPELAAASVAVAVFVIAWANAVWWLPDLRRRELLFDDRVDRRPPRPSGAAAAAAA